MSSLVKTLCRWYSTVHGLMNSWAAIAGLDRPSPASRPIWGSRAGSWAEGSVVRFRTRSPVHPAAVRCLDQLGRRPHGEHQLVQVLARLLRRRQPVLVAAQAVVERRSRPLKESQPRSLPTLRHVLRADLGQLGGLTFLAA